MTKRLYLAVLASAVLAACGSGSGDSSAPGPVLQTVQSSSSSGFKAAADTTVTFPRNRADYLISATATGFAVTDTIGGTTVAVTASQRLQFADLNVALDVDGGGGKIYRVYRAAFGRTPDAAGLGFWIGAIDQGVSLDSISAGFLASKESVDLYGAAPSNDALVTAMYTNVLRRTPDPAGYAFWVDVLNKNAATRAAVLAAISEGSENKTAVAPEIAAGFSYVPTSRVAGNTVPGAPVIGTATPGNASASIAFTAPSSNGGLAITIYSATCSGDSKTSSATGSASPIVVSNLFNGAAFTCSVKAANSIGYSVASAEVKVTPGIAATVPDAPTLSSATAGDASATLVFSAPANTGGAAISSYNASCTGGGASKTASGSASPIKVGSLTNGTSYSCSVQAVNAAGAGKASAALNVTPAAGATSSSITGHLYCPYTASVFNAALSLTNTVSVACSTSTRTMTGNGVPDHVTGTFPTGKNPSKIGAVSVNFQATLNPASTGSATAVAHIVGYAHNSVKFDPATAESYQNAGVWKIEALNQSYFPFGTDESNAHVQPDGAYHYHGMPEGYLAKLGKGQAMVLVGFAMDGFPMYARYGYSVASDASSALKTITPSWRMKSTPDAGRPSVSTVPMGTFTQDYEYVAGLGDLDECNGRTGVTPEFPKGIYHYYITDGYPYIQRCIKGTAMPPPPK